MNARQPPICQCLLQGQKRDITENSLILKTRIEQYILDINIVYHNSENLCTKQISYSATSTKIRIVWRILCTTSKPYKSMWIRSPFPTKLFFFAWLLLCLCENVANYLLPLKPIRTGYQIHRDIGIANKCKKTVELNNEHAFGNKVNIVSEWGTVYKEEFHTKVICILCNFSQLSNFHTM